jgi:NAD(P)-dependent dehydrogenase (short-subunit alcohol dehydrogenase family)
MTEKKVLLITGASRGMGVASQDDPPLRWAAGADAVEVLERKAGDLLTQADAYRELSSSLAHDDAS